jgi:hypothetical protein
MYSIFKNKLHLFVKKLLRVSAKQFKKKTVYQLSKIIITKTKN